MIEDDFNNIKSHLIMAFFNLVTILVIGCEIIITDH